MSCLNFFASCLRSRRENIEHRQIQGHSRRPLLPAEALEVSNPLVVDGEGSGEQSIEVLAGKRSVGFSADELQGAMPEPSAPPVQDDFAAETDLKSTAISKKQDQDADGGASTRSSDIPPAPCGFVPPGTRSGTPIYNPQHQVEVVPSKSSIDGTLNNMPFAGEIDVPFIVDPHV